MTTAKTIWPVILSGGSGTRLWPMSRSLYPKQLLPLVDSHSMLQTAVRRVMNGGRYGAPVLVANEEHRFIIAEQLRQTDCQPAAIILEPEGRNTAPAIALAARFVMERDPEALILVMPSDHLIRDEAAFRTAVEAAVAAAEEHRALLTFGIRPDRPETGYGYICCGAPLDGHNDVHSVDRFVEKPNLKTAEDYLASGNYVWNSGIFLFRAADFLEELAEFEPEMAEAAGEAMDKGRWDSLFFRPDRDAFRRCPSNSIDYAVMERTRRAAVVPVDMGWSDVGSWAALWEVSPKDATGNVLHGDVLVEGVSNCYARTDGPVVALTGVEDLIVVATADAVLVTCRERSQDVKMIVDQLKAKDRDEHMIHTVVHRPWGTYQTTDQGDRFQTKRIVVKPGEKLSLQKHHHRAEHWIVVQGTARVTCGEKVFDLHENESTFIPVGMTHRLERSGQDPAAPHRGAVRLLPWRG
ncbi:mannose-1-phosphate guanylyltransferase/mannose-6-phosphate isomerase [Pedomonas mirosovicensis]|uniref:mannose-1-phosphate guanylyltransferase/mannose-6-phosphate isomerase n=1 Tax=Pedomonas mirosovicensis TaxID=2908641 RepID=UPI00286F6DFA|nr:mannose-1-phosphate guanylyltransferase/mannose-6-phosphate isomerase [Pedomonas mirosovicensis]